MTLSFEDFPPGHFGTFGPHRVTREEILAFAAEFDPQPMHLDEEAASRSMLEGLSGSGWHLCSIMMRMMFDGYIGRTASLGSPGVNELRWLAPFRPGDDITLDVEVAEARVSRSRPTTGVVMFKMVARNASGQALCEMVSPIIVRRRGSLQGDATFTWWTESGTAKPGQDFMAVSPHQEVIEDGKNSVSLFIPVVGDATRQQPKSFYVVINDPGPGVTLGARTLTMVTIPPSQ